MRTGSRSSRIKDRVPDRAGLPAAMEASLVLGLAAGLMLCAGTGVSRAGVTITEFMADNEQTITNRLGKTSDWLEINNDGGAPVDLTGWHLTDDLADLSKWTFPATNVAAGEYLVVYASGDNGVYSGELHTSFKLSRDGEDLALVRDDLTIAYAYTNYPAQSTDISYGTGAAGEHRYFTTPTPGAANLAGSTGLVADTKFNPDRGLYTNAISVTITSATPGAAIYYTTNCGIPTTNDLLYTGAVPITNTTVLRAAAFKSGSVPTDTDTQSYIQLEDVLGRPPAPAGFPTNWVDRNGNATPADYAMDPAIVESALYGPMTTQAVEALPFLSIVTARTNLFDPDTGIYANPLESGIAWERVASVEYVATNNTDEFGLDGGLRVYGTTAERSFADTRKKSLSLVFRGEYGAGRLRYELFDEPTAVDSFNDLVMRAGAYDAWGENSLGAKAQYLRNSFLAHTQRAMVGVAPHSAFMHLYLDGLYWGVYDVSERPSGDFAADYFGGSGGNWDVFVRDWEEGDGDAYAALLALVHAGPVSNAVYRKIQGENPDGSRNPAYPVYFDPESYIDYVLLQMWSGNHRWIESNLCMMRNRDDTRSTGFKWCVWDSEAAMAEDGVGGLNIDMTARADPTGLRAALLGNDEFRLDFADRVQKHMFNGGALAPETAIARYRALADELEPAIVAESARWGDQAGGAPHTLSEWTAERDWILNTYLVQRGDIVLQQLRNIGAFPGIDAPTFSQHGGMFTNGFELSVSSSHTVYYTLDGTDPREYGTGTAVGMLYTSSIPLTYAVTVKARARGAPSNEWSALSEAVFTPATPTPLRITELMYHPRDPSGAETNIASGDDDFEFIELMNTGAQAVGLAGLRFTDGVSFDFSESAVRTLDSGDYLLLVKDTVAFTNRYGAIPGVIIAGEFEAVHDFPATRLADGGERVRMVDGLGRIVTVFTYGDGRGWPLAADGAGHSLVPMVSSNQASGMLDYGGNWRASAYLHGSPGRADPDPVRDVVINEIMAHTDASPPYESDDWIELFNTTASEFALNGEWYLSDDPDNLKAWPIPSTNVVPARGWISFDEIDDFHYQVTNGFGLSKAGDEVYLSYLPGTTNDRVVDCVRFYGQESEYSLGRYPDGHASWLTCQLTRNASNQLSSEPIAVFSEVMYHPRSTFLHPGNNTNDEFVELYNPSSQPVTLMNTVGDVGVWRVDGGIEFEFPSNTVIAAGSYLALVPFDPVTDSSALNAFLSAYGLTNGQVRLLGPYSGRLGNGGDSVRLERPVYPDGPNESVSWFVVDEVRYSDQSPWPWEPDGSGYSLRRNMGAIDGNEPANWVVAAAGTPGWFTSTFRNISASSSAGGVVIPSGDVGVPLSANATFDIVSSNYYHVADVVVDGTNSGPVGKVVFTNVVSGHTLAADFAPNLATNGTPEWWLAAYGLTGDFDAAALSDGDEDGMPAWAEFLADTAPNDAGSALVITGLTLNVGSVRVMWKGGREARQRLEFRPGLGATGDQWRAVFTNEPPTLLDGEYTHDTGTNGVGFYRLRVGRPGD